ncbi:MAG: adenine phosphoribosyltransferase [bacterium]|nr:adenine phosphoribosyltransferase [bacterium]
MVQEEVKKAIRDIPDFPKPGIVFKDITPIMQDAELSKAIVQHLKSIYKDQKVEAIAGIESRGFLFGYPLAMELGIPFILIRKKGKLPHKTISYDYDLEYGSATIEMHVDAVSKGQRVLVHDDLLATGGSAEAAAKLIQKGGAEIIGFDFLVELEFLKGADKLRSLSDNIRNLVAY